MVYWVPFPFRRGWLSNKRQSCLINQTTWVCLRNVFQEIQSRIKLGSQLVIVSVSPHPLSLLSHRERTETHHKLSQWPYMGQNLGWLCLGVIKIRGVVGWKQGHNEALVMLWISPEAWNILDAWGIYLLP